MDGASKGRRARERAGLSGSPVQQREQRQRNCDHGSVGSEAVLAVVKQLREQAKRGG
jgi:hypothetical protein